MTPEETDLIIGAVVALYGRPLAEVQDPAWHRLLADVAPAEAHAALVEYAAEHEFPPNPARLVALIAERRDPRPAWDEVKATVRRLLARHGQDNPPAWHELEARGEVHPHVAHFLAPRWREWCQSPDGDTTYLAQTRDAYHAISRRAQRDTALRLLGAERPAHAEPHRIDAGGLLGLPVSAEVREERDRRAEERERRAEAALEARRAEQRERAERRTAAARELEHRREAQAAEDERDRAAAERELERIRGLREPPA